jgi:uncharacterized protein (DUF169 family)
LRDNREARQGRENAYGENDDQAMEHGKRAVGVETCAQLTTSTGRAGGKNVTPFTESSSFSFGSVEGGER